MSASGDELSNALQTEEQLLAALPDSLPPDIAEALRKPGVSSWLRACLFEAVADWADLRGPDSGVVAIPAVFVGPPLSTEVPVHDAELLKLLYQRVLLNGSAVEQQKLLHPKLLAILWPALADDLPEPIVTVWEHRFPEHLSR